MATLNIFNPIDFHIFQKGNNYRLYSKVPVKYLEFMLRLCSFDVWLHKQEPPSIQAICVQLAKTEFCHRFFSQKS